MLKPITLDTLVSLCKRRGFIYQGSEIYDGLAGTWDYGPLGVLLKNNIKASWWKTFVDSRDDMYGLDAAILMNQAVWQASGHVAGFSDPLVECLDCHQKFRLDHLQTEGDQALSKCPNCRKNNWSKPSTFNMMFQTKVGASDDTASVSYLRPETAQGIFVNFKNVVDSFHPNLPFGIGQIGKAFRNEITPKDFIFRVREFEQMEVEYFVQPETWAEHFTKWQEALKAWAISIGVDQGSFHELEVGEDDRAHYSKRTIDFEFDYPFGRKELFGLAYRGDYDLSKHQEGSGADLSFQDQLTGEKFIPHVIEPSVGVDRMVLAVLLSAYKTDTQNDEERVFLALPKAIAPIKVAVFPLLKNKPDLVNKAKEVYQTLKTIVPNITFDDNGNIGKRYRRQDEIGTPICITIDFDTLTDDTVTVRDRDTATQTRVKISDLSTLL